MDEKLCALIVVLVVLMLAVGPLLVYVCWNFVMVPLGVAALPTVWHSFVFCFLLILMGGFMRGFQFNSKS